MWISIVDWLLIVRALDDLNISEILKEILNEFTFKP